MGYSLNRTESQIQTEICKYLRAKNYFFWRQNNAGIWDRKKDAYRINYYSTKGVPDIFCIHNKKIYAIEVKRNAEDQSKHQIVWENNFVKYGGEDRFIYQVCRSVQDVMDLGL